MKKTSKDGVVVYEITESTDSDTETVTAHVILKAMMSDYRESLSTKPWRKFNAKAARNLLISEGYEVGECLEASPNMNNAAADASGAWVFENLSALSKDPPVQPVKKKPTRAKRTIKPTKKS